MTEHLAHDPHSPHGGPLSAAPAKAKKAPRSKPKPETLPPVVNDAPTGAADALAALDALREEEG